MITDHCDQDNNKNDNHDHSQYAQTWRHFGGIDHGPNLCHWALRIDDHRALLTRRL